MRVNLKNQGFTGPCPTRSYFWILPLAKNTRGIDQIKPSMRSGGKISLRLSMREQIYNISTYSSKTFTANCGLVGKHGSGEHGIRYDPDTKITKLEDDRRDDQDIYFLVFLLYITNLLLKCCLSSYVLSSKTEVEGASA